jgi:hypothetical protein
MLYADDGAMDERITAQQVMSSSYRIRLIVEGFLVWESA